MWTMADEDPLVYRFRASLEAALAAFTPPSVRAIH
jgi:hypothetical protein